MQGWASTTTVALEMTHAYKDLHLIGVIVMLTYNIMLAWTYNIMLAWANWMNLSIGSGDGLVPNKRQAITRS